jgi:hypothetical protein
MYDLLQLYVFTRTNKNIYVYVCMYVCVCIYIYIYFMLSHTHTHTHALLVVEFIYIYMLTSIVYICFAEVYIFILLFYSKFTPTRPFRLALVFKGLHGLELFIVELKHIITPTKLLARPGVVSVTIYIHML